MDIFSELSGMEDHCFNFQWGVNSFDDETGSMGMEAAAFGDNYMHHLHAHAPVFDHHYKPVMEPSARPSKQLKSNSFNSCITTDQSMMNQNLPHGGDSISGIADQGTLPIPKEEGTVSSKSTNGNGFQFVNQNNQAFNNGGAKVISTSNNTRLTPAQDHILSERKRREKLNQRFIALSALVPGLKKMDKASVLGDAIKHLKNLQEKVKTLEEQTKKKANTESVVYVKRYEILANGGEISSSDGPVHEQLPEIEARFSGKDVLIRIHCEKKAGVVEKTLAEIENLQLSVINSTAMTFAGNALDIIVIAQMGKEFSMTMKDLMKNLHFALKKFM